MQRCIDDQNTVVDDDLCHAIGEQRVLGSRVQPPNYRYYYGGGGGFTPGAIVTGGSYAPLAGHSYAVGNGTSRGGFGRLFSGGSSGGDSGGAGE